MSQVLKSSELSLDLNKEVVVIGKGPSSSLVLDHDTSNSYVASLNSSCVILDKVIDFLFFNDFVTIENILKHDYDLNKIKNIVCPIQLHANERVSKYTYTDVLHELHKYQINIFTYRLQTQKINSPSSTDSMFFNCYSTAISAFYWLTHIGFKKFNIFGISKSNEYNNIFKSKKDCGLNRENAWYVNNFKYSVNILKNKSCSYNFF